MSVALLEETCWVRRNITFIEIIAHWKKKTLSPGDKLFVDFVPTSPQLFLSQMINLNVIVCSSNFQIHLTKICLPLILKNHQDYHIVYCLNWNTFERNANIINNQAKTDRIWRFSYFSQDHTYSKWLDRYSGFMLNVLPRTLL